MKTFVTTYRKSDGLYGGEVEALDFEHAQRICDERDLGETVEGELMGTIPADQTTPANVQEICDSMNDEQERFGERNW